MLSTPPATTMSSHPLATFCALPPPSGERLALRLAAISMTAAVAGLAAAELLQRWARRRLEA